jgi:phosphatidylinositol alpha-1,6-mannosyltransferase
MPAIPGVLLLTELYPPTLGGSAILFESLYTRLHLPVQVLTHGEKATRHQRGLSVTSIPMAAADWGLLKPSCLRRHLQVAAAVRNLAPRTVVVHCGRALPEGLSALMAPRRYLCWTHGEELGFASTSRELTSLMKLVYRRAAGVLANSHNSARLLAGWGVPQGRIAVIHPGVDPGRFHPAADPADWRSRYAAPGEVIFLSVGRLQRRKGHDLALQALAQLSDLRVRYLIAGEGPAQGDLEDQTRNLGLGSRVHFLGAVPDADLPSLYAASDVFVMPNREEGVDFEGFGIVFLEAAATGRPAIGGRSGGVSEAVADSETGVLVGGMEVIELAQAMRRLATSAQTRASMGAAGRARVLRSFTWDHGAALLDAAHRRFTGVDSIAVSS